MLITFEGVEGCGKSTQANKLNKYLQEQGRQVVMTREPGGTPLAEKIRELVLDPECQNMHCLTELLLYAASRAQHTQELIKPALDSGQIVICDRYLDSTTAYQGYGRQLDQGLIGTLNAIATQNIKPQLTLVLDVPAEIGLERIKAKGREMDRLELEELAFHQRVGAGFKAMAQQEPGRIKIVDGTKGEEEVFAQVLTYYKEQGEAKCK